MNPRWFLRLYPRAWRERYGDEVDLLLSQTPATWSTCADVLMGALHEWIAPLGLGPIRRRIRWAGLACVVLPWVGGIALMQGGELLGRSMAWPSLPSWPPLGLIVELAAILRGGIAMWASIMLMHRPRSSRLRRFRVSASELSIWMAAVFAAGVAVGLGEVQTFAPWWRPSPLFLLTLSSYQSSRLGLVATRLSRRDRRQKIRRSVRPFLLP